MKHCMTVGTNRYKVIDRVYNIALTKLADWRNVMNVDESFSEYPVLCSKVDSTSCTTSSIVFDAGVSCSAIPFVAINEILGTLPLLKLGARNILVSEDRDFVHSIGSKRPIYPNWSLS